MTGDDESYVYDEATGEWLPPGSATAAAEAVVVRDAAGNALADGDSVTLIKDLKVKGTSTTLKQGTVIRSIRLTEDPEEIDCRHDTIKVWSCAPSSYASAEAASRHCERSEAIQGNGPPQDVALPWAASLRSQ